MPSSSEATPGTLRDDLSTLQRALAGPDALARREEIKADIIGLFRAVEREIAGLAVLKDDVKALVQTWKALEGGVAADTPEAQSVEAPTRADHLNASTYLEKGWSLMSLGDHIGAEAALQHALVLSPNDPQGLSLLGWAQMLQEK